MGGSRGAERPLSSAGLSRRLGPSVTGLLREAGALARGRGERACLVGGCVRDLLLGRPARDLDLVVEGDGPGLARALARTLRGGYHGHPAFGTATVELAGLGRLDLATARRERYAAPAALPRVEPADLRSDLLRRDFTVNCLALDLSPGRFGRLIDPSGGREDLLAGRIRVLHDRSFLDDPTRIFRALRFAVRLGFRLAPQTARLLGSAIRDGMVERLSAARLRREVAAVLEEEEATAAARALRRHRVWVRIDPALVVGAPALTRLERYRRLTARLGSDAREGAAPAWAGSLALLAFERPAARRRLSSRLRPDRRSRELLERGPAEARALLRSLRRARRPRPGTVWNACRDLPSDVVELACVVTERPGLRRDLERYLSEWRRARADIDGSDLLAAGFRPGPAIARGLRAALRAKLDGRAPGREEQLARALRAARRA